jgi:hypothetical protein
MNPNSPIAIETKKHGSDGVTSMLVFTANTQPLPDFAITVGHVMSKRRACSAEV